MVEDTKALAEWRRKQSEGGKKGAAKRWGPRRRFWAALLARQQDSGLNVEAFCAREGVHPTSLYGWRRRLGFCGRREEDSRPEMSVVPAGAPGFVELVPAALPCLSSGLRLRLPGRVVVEVDRGFDRDTLASALAVVLESR